MTTHLPSPDATIIRSAILAIGVEIIVASTGHPREEVLASICLTYNTIVSIGEGESGDHLDPKGAGDEG